jgi:hypothetical protein
VRTIHFYPNTAAGEFDQAKFNSLRSFLLLDLPLFEYDQDYESFVRANAGGSPIERYFSSNVGIYPIDHFLNFQASRSASDPFAFLNVNVVWSAIEDRLTSMQFPFASLPGGDFLCFDYSQGERPSVVLWLHELSGEDSPMFEPVANTFSEFLASLRSGA